MTGKQPKDSPKGSKPASQVAPGLHVVATPIGNLGDISLRALEVLRAVDLVACEDTRLTGRLLERHGIRARLTPYHEHNAARARPGLLRRLTAGEAIALVSDAGTPLVSDPGYKLLRAAIAAGIPISACPGACAPLMALTLSGLPTDRFMFAGFLPPRRAARRQALAELAQIRATLIVLESARRLGASLDDMARVLGDRPAVVARELTKRHEEMRRGSLAALASHYAESGPPKGEIVVLVAPPRADDRAGPDEAELDRLLADALKTMSVRDAAGALAAETGLPRRTLYARAVRLSKAGPKPDPEGGP